MRLLAVLLIVRCRLPHVGKIPAPKAIPGHKVLQARKALKEFKEWRERRDRRGLRVRKARKALLAKRVRRAKKERKGTRVIKAIPERETKETKGTGARKAMQEHQFDGQVACEANEILASVFCPSGGTPDGAKCPAPPTVGLCFKRP